MTISTEIATPAGGRAAEPRRPPARRVRARPDGRLHLPCTSRGALARRQRVPCRGRCPPGAPALRAGAVRRHARCSEPDLEAGAGRRRQGGRLRCWTPTSPSADLTRGTGSSRQPRWRLSCRPPMPRQRPAATPTSVPIPRIRLPRHPHSGRGFTPASPSSTPASSRSNRCTTVSTASMTRWACASSSRPPKRWCQR